MGNPYNFANATSAGCPANHQSITCWFNPTAYAIPQTAPGGHLPPYLEMQGWGRYGGQLNTISMRLYSRASNCRERWTSSFALKFSMY